MVSDTLVLSQIQGQFDGVNTTEILCYQNCVRLNTLTGIFTTLSFQLEDGNPGCWCKTNAANAYSTLSDYSTLFTTSLVGSCASYSTNCKCLLIFLFDVVKLNS